MVSCRSRYKKTLKSVFLKFYTCIVCFRSCSSVTHTHHFLQGFPFLMLSSTVSCTVVQLNLHLGLYWLFVFVCLALPLLSLLTVFISVSISLLLFVTFTPSPSLCLFICPTTSSPINWVNPSLLLFCHLLFLHFCFSYFCSSLPFISLTLSHISISLLIHSLFFFLHLSG